MNFKIWGLASLVWFFCIVPNLVSATGQETELEVLRHYEGTWDCRFAIKPQANESNESDAKRYSGTVTGKWVVGDRFLEQTGTYRLDESSPSIVIKTMMTYDQKQNRYQFDYFISTGEIRRSFGKWDADAQSMVSTMTNAEDGTVTTLVADFSVTDTEKWTIETKNRDGITVTKISGTNKRRK